MTDEPSTQPDAAAPAPPADEPTKAELLEHARELNVDGRSKMDRDELVDAIAEAQARAAGHIGVTTDGQAQAAATTVPNLVDEPTPADVVGRPPLTSLAEERAANRNPRVIGAP